MKSNRNQPENRSDLHIHKAGGVYLKSRKTPLDGFHHHLMSDYPKFSYPINESASLVWKYCTESIRVADLVQVLTTHFPESRSIQSDVLEMLNQFQTLGLLTLSQEPKRVVKRPTDYPPVRQDCLETIDSYSDCGIIITVHNHVARFGLPCLKSVLEHSGDAKVYLYDNESSDPDIWDLKRLADAQPAVEFIRVDDQTVFGGLTGTWNDGIVRAHREGLKKVILLNHDVVVDATWGNFIRSIDSDYCIYGPLSNRPGGGGGKRPQMSNAPTFNGLQRVEKLLGFCMGFTLGRPELKLFDDWRFFDPAFPFGGNEFGIQRQMKKRSPKTKLYVVTDTMVFHHLNMGWKGHPRYPDPHDPTPRFATPTVQHEGRYTHQTDYATCYSDNNLAHILREEILPLGKIDTAKLKKSNLYIDDKKIDREKPQQKWREFVLSNIFDQLVYVGADRISHKINPTWLETKSAYHPHEFVDYPPKIEYIQLSEFIKKNAGIKIREQEYVLLSQRPEGKRYLLESESGLPLEKYLSCALEKRGIPFKYCDFGVITPSEQAQLCGSAKIFISAHGAGCSNIIFTPRSCHVLEYNFRKYWNCNPVCDPHFDGTLEDHEECEAELAFRPYFHKADYHNLCRLLGRPYTELEVVRYDGFIDRNPISRRYLFVDGISLLEKIEERVSS